MQGLVCPLREFLAEKTEHQVSLLRSIYPEAKESQARSWSVLMDDVKSAGNIRDLPGDTVIAVEYALSVDGMAIDLIIAGLSASGRKVAVIVESKQWDDAYIRSHEFSIDRVPEKELNPQIQIRRHEIGFKDYLNIGGEYDVHPYVYIRNSTYGTAKTVALSNPKPSNMIPVYTDMEAVVGSARGFICEGSSKINEDLVSAWYEPSKGIMRAMGSIVTKEEPFLLTKEQEEAVKKIKESVRKGKKIVRITGPAGSGKTAILLNLYVEYLHEGSRGGLRPIFVSGAQNTKVYRNKYPEVQYSFSYSYGLERTVGNEGDSYIIFMDEAQHNAEGIITNMIRQGATLIICYDEGQVINDNNALQELYMLQGREDFAAIELQESVRFNGSRVAERNIRACLMGEMAFAPDDRFEFQMFTDFTAFQEKILCTMRAYPDRTVAVTGLLCSDAEEHTVDGNLSSRLFTRWGYGSECAWMRYVQEKGYLDRNGGDIWVGTWWMPGLDVDYVAVIAGGDAIMTEKGIAGDPGVSKHYKMMMSVADKMGFLGELTVMRTGQDRRATVDNYGTCQNILRYINQSGKETVKEKFLARFSYLLRNNYYIMMSRGRKGCFVYFAEREGDRK